MREKITLCPQVKYGDGFSHNSQLPTDVFCMFYVYDFYQIK